MILVAITIEGIAKKKLFPKTKSADDNGFKIYSFVPKNKEEVKLNQYGNIVIKGIMPELLIDDQQYSFDVEYEFKNGKESYNVVKINVTEVSASEKSSVSYLLQFTSEKRAEAILEKYPNFVQDVLDGKNLSCVGIKNVGDKTFKKIISKVTEEIVYFGLITEYSEYQLTPNQIKNIFDTYKSTEIIREKMEKNPYGCLCEVGGIGFKTADYKILQHNKKFINTPYRMIECIMYVLGQNELEGNTLMLTEDLYGACKELTPECMDYFYRVIMKSERVYLSEERDKVAKMRTYEAEKRVSKRLSESAQSNHPLYYDDRILTEKDITDKYRQIGDIVLTEQQNQLIPAFLQSHVTVLAGFAGAGKSSSCKALINFLEDHYVSYMLLAPTGRASAVLSAYTDRTASTIHRALGAIGNQFTYDEHNQLAVDVVIVDEASMIDVFLFDALLKALPKYTKMLFVCDPAQIPSVGAGNVIQDIILSRRFNVVMLDKVFRYGEGGLSYVATNARNGAKFLGTDNVQEFGLNKDYIFKQTDEEEIVNNAVQKYVQLVNSGVDINDIAIVSCYNKGQYGTLQINNLIQSIINPPTHKNDELVKCTKDKTEIYYHVGDRVMQIKNNYHVQLYKTVIDDEEEECTLYNGDFGIIKQINNDGSLVCDFDGKLVLINKQEVSDLLLGYAVSCHKMQGDSRSNIIFITPKAHTYMLNRNLIYVALTRAKKNLYHYGNTKTVNNALRKSENLSRKTFMVGLIQKLF